MILIPMITGTEITFWICAVLAILGAVGLVTFHKPVYSALCLALVMISLAVIYASLGAPFLFAVQIIVYTGAILMLFLFVIMLVGVSSEDSFATTIKGHGVTVAIAGVGVLILLAVAVIQGVVDSPVGMDAANAGGNVQGLAQLIFSKYVIAFESTAALLITAAVAAMVLAHPEVIKKKPGQAERAAERLEAYVNDGINPGPRPNSGIFARHNSIATPALLPDGSVAQDSVSRVLADRIPLPSPEDLWAPHEEAILAIEEAEEEPEEVDVEMDADVEIDIVLPPGVDLENAEVGTIEVEVVPEETETVPTPDAEADAVPEDGEEKSDD